MLAQVRLAAYGLRYLSLVLFVESNGEVRLRFATPDVLCRCRPTASVHLRSSTVHRRSGPSRGGAGAFQPPSLIPPAVL